MLATEGNLNNDIGMPLTLLRLRADASLRGAGNGHEPCRRNRLSDASGRAHVALVNNAPVGAYRFARLDGSHRAAKGEIFDGLRMRRRGGDQCRRPACRPVARGQCAALRDRLRHRQPAPWCAGNASPVILVQALTLTLPNGDPRRFALQVAGRAQRANALPRRRPPLRSTSASLQQSSHGLAGLRGVKGRLQNKAAPARRTFIDDTYNANPDSVKAALGGTGAAARQENSGAGRHGRTGRRCRGASCTDRSGGARSGGGQAAGAGRLVAGNRPAFGAGALHFERIQELLADLENELAPDVTVLVKGSRAS